MTPATGSLWGYALRAFLIGVGVLLVLTLLAVLLVFGWLRLRDALEPFRQRRARRRFTREAIAAAEHRQAEHARAAAEREREFQQDWDRAWRMLTSAPELRDPERS